METRSPVLDNEFGKFPSHMYTAQNVFEFSYADADQVTQRFRSNADLLQALDEVLQTVLRSSLSDEDKKTLADLLADEKDVVSFARVARNSVIAL